VFSYSQAELHFVPSCCRVPCWERTKARQEWGTYSITFPEFCLRNPLGGNAVAKSLSYKTYQNMSVFQIYSKKKSICPLTEKYHRKIRHIWP